MQPEIIPQMKSYHLTDFQRAAYHKMPAISIIMDQALSPSWDFVRLDMFCLKCQNVTESQINVYFVWFNLWQGSILLHKRFLNEAIHFRIYGLITTLIQTQADNSLPTDKNCRNDFTPFGHIKSKVLYHPHITFWKVKSHELFILR